MQRMHWRTFVKLAPKTIAKLVVRALIHTDKNALPRIGDETNSSSLNAFESVDSRDDGGDLCHERRNKESIGCFELRVRFKPRQIKQ